MSNAINATGVVIGRIYETIVVECFGFAGMFAVVTAFGRRAVQIPKYAPPRAEEPGRLTKSDIFVPADLAEERLRRFGGACVQ